MSKTTITPQDALAERAKRELARRRFLRFAEYVDPRYPVHARHIELLTNKLEQVARYTETKGAEGIGRLMVFMPPRYYKSNTASQKFPAWFLGRNPDKRVIMVSYGADLASEHSKAVRDIILSAEYQAVFGALSAKDDPVELSMDSRSAQRWSLSAPHIGGMLSAGVDGAIVGKGGHLLIMDDPLKNRQEAESESRRELIRKFYRSSFYTRREDGAAIIIILTRWDQDDIAGYLLNEMVGDPMSDQWDVIFLPAIALEEKVYPKTEAEFKEYLLRGMYVPMGGDQLGRQAGEPLWEEKHSAGELAKIRANIDDFEFESQYQQMPRLAEGGFFDDDDFRIVERAPDGLRWYWYLDLALGESERSDFNATAGVALDKDGNLYIRDALVERELEGFLADVRGLMLSDAERGSIWGVEDTAFQKLIFKDFMKDKALANKEILAVKPEGDKVERARPWRRRAKQKKVFLVRGAWNLSFIRTAASFPTSARHDDEIDMVSGAVQMMAEDAGERKAVTIQAQVSEYAF